MDAHEHHYRKVWLSLLGLMALSIAASMVGLPPRLLLALVFGVALAKAVLVAREFMHFKDAPPLIVLAVASPLFLLAAMLCLMFPDFVGVKSGPEFLQ